MLEIRQFLIQVLHVSNASNLYVLVTRRLDNPRNKHQTILSKFPAATELDLIPKHGSRV